MDIQTNEQNNEITREEHELDTSLIEIRGHLLKCEEKLIQISNIQAVSYWIENEPPKPAEIDMLLKESERKKGEIEQKLEKGKKQSEKGKTIGIFGAIAAFMGLTLISSLMILGILLLFGGGFACYNGIQNYKEGQKLISDCKELAREALQCKNRAEQLARNYELLKEQAKFKKFLNLYLNSGWRYSINFGNNKPLLMKAYNCLSGIFEKGGKADATYYIDISKSTFNGQNIIAETISDSNIENTMTSSDSKEQAQ